MYVKAAKLAHESIYETKDISLEKFLDSIKDVAMPHLDKEFGATVTDPQVFVKVTFVLGKKITKIWLD